MLCCGQRTAQHHQPHNRAFRAHAAATNNPDFLLAAQVVAETLCERIMRTGGQPPGSGCRGWWWWREYTHPVRWDMVPPGQQQQARDACERSRTLLASALTAFMHARLSGAALATGLEELAQLLRREHYGEIVGFLSCNVSGVNVPSPVQQYLARLVKLRDRSKNKGTHRAKKRRKRGTKQTNNNNNNNNSSVRRDAAAVDVESIERLVPRLGAAVAEACDLDLPAAPDNLDSLAAAWPGVRGAAVYPVLSFANHDCDPNCEIVFRGPDNTASLVSLCPVAAGEELTISYIDNCWSDSDEDDSDDGSGDTEPNSRSAARPPWHWRSRREALLARYGFACECERCHDERQDEVSRQQRQSKKEK